MPDLLPGNEEHLAAIYRESHAVWGAGLSLADYRGTWDDVVGTPWGARHASFWVWTGRRGELLSSLKLYRPLVRVAGHTTRASVVGAVFTPRARRGLGHARDLLRAVLQRCEAEGASLAMLFTDIGPALYADAGFRTLPADETNGTLAEHPDLPESWELGPATVEDRDSIHAAHEDSTRRSSIAVVRDAEHWRFLDVRTGSYFARLGDPGVRERCIVVQHEGCFAGYLSTVEGRGLWSVREAGAAGGDPSRVAAIVRAGAALAAQAGLRRFKAWLPREVSSRLGPLRAHSRPRSNAVPMVRALGSGSLPPLDGPDAGFIPFQDQF
ncbi:MAG: GNAT family N-acetyltransferase [bacterium]|nr:GNAT family N-acetyltransferase [bacterium]